MKILSLSDVIVPFIYSPQIQERFSGTDLVISCGDLPYYYEEYVISALNVPLVFVRGNHSKVIEYSTGGQRKASLGGNDLHGRVMDYRGLLLAGIEGSGRYRDGPFQYSQSEMWFHVLKLIPSLLANRIQHGRFLDIFITHAPPAGIHDQPDLPHHGIRAFRWFLQVFKPAYHLHGHIHVYHPDTVTQTQFGPTCVLNTFGFRELVIDLPGKSNGKLGRG